MIVQDHSKEDNTNLLRVCNTFNKYTLLSLITTGTLTVWPSVYINSILELNRSPIMTARYATSTAHSLLCIHKADEYGTMSGQRLK